VQDQYAESAEYIDIMSRPSWELFGPALAEALEGLDTAAGPVVDVGAGTGLGTEVIARTLPDARILAVEPSSGLRGVLLSRLASSDDLRRRVTVLPTGIETAPLPETLSAVVAMNMIGHLAPEARRGFWKLLDDRLAPGGRAVVNLLPPHQAAETPDAQFTGITIGRHLYEGWGRAEPAGADAVAWHMTYRVFDSDDHRMLRTVRVDYRWWVLSAEQLGAELAAQGLTMTAAGPPDADVYAIARQGVQVQ
jgi:cyclopropane fatty-acyl-phospholipid synthase-like methyltransferase